MTSIDNHVSDYTCVSINLIACTSKYSKTLRLMLFLVKQDAYHRRKHEPRIRTSTALIAREINMRELKQNSQHFS